MMKIRVLMISIAASAVVFYGCATFIAGGIGAIADQSSEKTIRIAMGGLFSVERGTSIIAILTDSSKVAGKYFGFAGIFPDSIQLSNPVSEDSMAMPYYCEPIMLTESSGRERRCLYDGFFYHRDKDKWIPQVAGYSDGISQVLDLDKISAIKDSRDKIISGSWMINSANKTLVRSAVIIKSISTSFAIPMSRIDHVEIKPNKHATEMGLLLGFVLDISIYLYLRFIFSGAATRID
ncbi:MAG TPA: hypothetical protein DEO84_10290 [candidate division Zixibacteria bacterium]|nr:hypothetical protein [candidate division Zixibacteria bacterium]HBZ01694.1 hypothetical protein [candidate division Zixibacteria bacterium]